LWPTQGLVGSIRGDIVVESAYSRYELDHVLKRERFTIKAPLLMDCTCVSIGRDGFWDNYYHSLIDNLPRIYALHREPFSRWHEIVMLLSREPRDYERVVLEAILPCNVRTVVIRHANACVRPRKAVLLPFLSEGYGRASLPSEYIKWFQARLFERLSIHPVPAQNERVYVSRAQAAKRRFTNERAFVDALIAIGFKCVFLEQLTFSEQVALFSRAGCVVARHGAGLTNLLFAQGCSVLEICDSDCRRNYYRALAASMRLRYANIVVNDTARDADVTVPIGAVLERIDQLLHDKGTSDKTECLNG